MHLDQLFAREYDFYQEMIANGTLDGVMGIIWDSEDSAGAIFTLLDSDKDKAMYIQDFKNAVEWLRTWQGEFGDEDYEFVARNVIEEREN